MFSPHHDVSQKRVGDRDALLFKPYRVIYRVIDESVVITLIADGRRDMQTLLARRLLGAP